MMGDSMVEIKIPDYEEFLLMNYKEGYLRWLDTQKPYGKSSLTASPMEEIVIGAFETRDLRYYSKPENEIYRQRQSEYMAGFKMLSRLFGEIVVKYEPDDRVKNLAQELDRKMREAIVTVCMSNFVDAWLG